MVFLRVLFNGTMISPGLICILLLTIPKIQYALFGKLLCIEVMLFRGLFIAISALRGDSQLRAYHCVCTIRAAFSEYIRLQFSASHFCNSTAPRKPERPPRDMYKTWSKRGHKSSALQLMGDFRRRLCWRAFNRKYIFWEHWCAAGFAIAELSLLSHPLFLL